MARTVTLYKVTQIKPDAVLVTWFPTKSGANANIVDQSRLCPDNDFRIDTKTIDLDKDGVTALLNEVTCDYQRRLNIFEYGLEKV